MAEGKPTGTMRARILDLMRQGVPQADIARQIHRTTNYVNAAVSQLRKQNKLPPKAPTPPTAPYKPSGPPDAPVVVGPASPGEEPEDVVVHTRVGTFDLLTGRVSLETDVSIETLLFWQALRTQNGNEDPFGVFLDSLARYVRQDLGFDLVFPADRDLTAIIQDATQAAQGNDPGWDVPVDIQSSPKSPSGNGHGEEVYPEDEGKALPEDQVENLVEEVIPIVSSDEATAPEGAESDKEEQSDVQYSEDSTAGKGESGQSGGERPTSTRVSSGQGVEGGTGGQGGSQQAETVQPDNGGRAKSVRSRNKKAGSRALRVRRS